MIENLLIPSGVPLFKKQSKIYKPESSGSPSPRRRRCARVATRTDRNHDTYRVLGAPSSKMQICTRVTTRGSRNDASTEFGCSLTLKIAKHLSDHSQGSIKYSTIQTTHALDNFPSGCLSDSSPEHAKAPRVTTNSSLDRLFQVGEILLGSAPQKHIFLDHYTLCPDATKD